MDNIFRPIIDVMSEECRLCNTQAGCLFGGGWNDCRDCSAARSCPVCTKKKEIKFLMPDYQCITAIMGYSEAEKNWERRSSLCPITKEYILFSVSELHDFLFHFSPCELEIKNLIFQISLTTIDFICLLQKFNGGDDIDFPQLCKSMGIEYTRAELSNRIPETVYNALVGKKTNFVKGRTKKEDIQGISIDTIKLRGYLVKDFSDFDKLEKDMQSKAEWTQTDIGRMAMLLHLSGSLNTAKNRKDWIPEFFECLGRDDIPTSISTSNYKFPETDIDYWKRFTYLTQKIEKPDKISYNINF